MSIEINGNVPLSELIQPYLEWPPIADDTPSQRLKFILATLDDPRFPGGIIPRFKNGYMSYYAITNSAHDQAQLYPMLQATIGWTVTDYIGSLAKLAEDDPFESLLIEHELRSSKFTAYDPELRTELRNNVGRYASTALARLHRLCEENPMRSREIGMTTGQLLQRFDYMIAARDQNAGKIITQLENAGQLDALNLEEDHGNPNVDARETLEGERQKLKDADLCKLPVQLFLLKMEHYFDMS